MFDLKGFRKDKKITQAGLDEILQCGQAYISQIETFKRPMPPEYLDILKEKFGDISGYYIEDVPKKKKEKKVELATTNMNSIPIEFVQALLEERKLHDTKELELIQQNRDLIDIVKNTLLNIERKISPCAPEVGDAGCATASGMDVKR